LIVTITWEGSDPDGEPVTFDLFWGPQSPPTALRQSNLATPSADIGGLTFLQTVYWRIRIRDSHGATTLGPVWSFTTGANSPPTQASDPAPENNGYAGSATSLQWGAATDPNTLPSYLVYFGTTNPPPYLAAILDTQFETGAFEAGLQYFWRIDVSDGTVVTTGELWAFHGGSQPTVVEPVPTVLTLGRNHPNPFNPQTIIPYSVPAGKTVRVRMTIFDTAGSVVRVLLDEDQNGGAREVVWKGDDDRGATVSSGVYYCVLHVGDERRTQKLVLLK